MNNCCKINLDLFFTDWNNKQISPEFQRAYETLADQPENSEENSVEKFIAELNSRLALIQPILGDQTEEFLGYCQEDITKLSDFFAHKFRKFGMDAVEVQKILRRIWLATPCKDKRLNYDLYNCVNYAFELIVGPAKEKISFSEIPAPVDNKWETLVEDWKARRAYYAEQLQIDIDYLDSEAVDGTIFPSVSGLFAYPANPKNNECCVLEFLNFWMPHLIQAVADKSESVNNMFVTTQLFEYVNSTLKNVYDPNNWLQPYKECFWDVAGHVLVWRTNNTEKLSGDLKKSLKKIQLALDSLANESEKFVSETTEAFFAEKATAFFKTSKDELCEFLSEYYKGLQPTHFWQEPAREEGDGPQGIPGDTTPRIWKTPNDNGLYDDRCNPGYGDIYVNLWHQLPNFVNACDEYIVKDARIYKSKDLEFYGNGEKVYFPNDTCVAAVLQKWFRAFEAVRTPVPSSGDIAELEEYYQNCYLKIHALPHIFEESSTWDTRARNIIRRRERKFEEALFQYVQSVVNEDLSPANKQSILSVIMERFSQCPSDFLFELYKLHRIEDKNKVVEQPYDSRKSAFVSRIECIRLHDKSEREQEKVKETEIKARVQKDNFVTINHSIKNLITSIHGALSRLERRLPSEQEFMCNLLRQAKQGVVIASDLANAITCSYRQTGEELWYEDLLPGNAKWSVQDILYDALSASIPHMFFRRYSQYEQECKNYFPDTDEAVRAENSWYDLSDIDARLNWINQNLFHIKVDDAEIASCKVGNKYSTKTHLYILFNEILLNAVKAASYVDKDQRMITIRLTYQDGDICVDISNSANQNRGVSGGYGKIIIDNYKSMFNMPDFYSGYDTTAKCYQVKFTLPFSK